MLERQPLLPLLQRALGHRPSPPTIWRWVNRGVKVGDDRVKLNALKIGGKFYASPADVEQFIADQNPPAVEPPVEESERTPELEQKLAEAGLV